MRTAVATAPDRRPVAPRTPAGPDRPAGTAPPTRAPVGPPAAAPAAPAVPASRPAVRTSPLPADTLLALSRRGLLEAEGATRPVDRYATAHLAALRAAAAVLAAAPGRPRDRSPVPAAQRLGAARAVAPELGEWAAFFAAGAAKRAAAEAGVPAAVTEREADDLLRDAGAFLAVVETALGGAHQPLLATS